MPYYSATLARPLEPGSSGSGETANQITHGFGFALSLLGTIVMLPVAAGGSSLRLIACGIYCFTLTALYAASTLSHSFADPKLRERFRTLDQICIFFLIVGTFTPIAVVHLEGLACWGLLGAMWLTAVVGSVQRCLRGDRSVWWYIALGWLPIVAINDLAAIAGPDGLLLVVGGGIVYTVGTLFLLMDGRHPQLHAVWHLFVIAGSLFHYLFVYEYVAAAAV